MVQLQNLMLLLASAVAGTMIAHLSMKRYGKTLIVPFGHRKLTFDIGAPLSTIANRAQSLRGKDIPIPDSKAKYRIALLPDNAFVFERVQTRFDPFTSVIEGVLADNKGNTSVEAHIRLSRSTVANLLAMLPTMWILVPLHHLFFGTQPYPNFFSIYAFLLFGLPLLLVGFFRAQIFFNADIWQGDINAFDSIICNNDGA